MKKVFPRPKGGWTIRRIHHFLGLDTIVGVTHPHNFASQHVLRKCGLVYEREFVHHNDTCALFRTAPRTRVLM